MQEGDSSADASTEDSASTSYASSEKKGTNEKLDSVTEPKKLGLKSLFATPTMTKITLIMWVNWIVVTIGYYGISLGIGDVGSDVFINFLLVGT